MTDMRHVRVEEDLWRKAIRKAHAQGITVSTLVRDMLDDYVNNEESAIEGLERIIVRLHTIHKRLKIGE